MVCAKLTRKLRYLETDYSTKKLHPKVYTVLQIHERGGFKVK